MDGSTQPSQAMPTPSAPFAAVARSAGFAAQAATPQELPARACDPSFPPDVHDKAGPSKQFAQSEDTGEPVFEPPGERVRHDPWHAAAKRAFDLAASGAALWVGAPALLAIAAAVKLDSPGPALYKQTRVGQDGVPFECLKFRSMTVDAEKDGPRWARSFDSRVTRVGGILRRTSLDELPQLINVLRGDMSLVGPRPERPVFVARFRKQYPDYDLRHTVRPGLSGWAQVNGLRGNVSIADRTVYDVWYVRNFSLWLDAQILVRTFSAVLAGE
ncbi:MAG: exopolysaccharide biosynthesis polyprenyl glycosylphosphotransferase [Deltaproteobacteria bacterium]|nr:exopolysaccharide biosynthesis polyprenyl glycosylphosphotransferase [Deltaproteobacteria bacterium]